ncbi:MalY/PatB family protein [Deinococcus sp. Leaf326]|uniref:MalY/PatB family protein n=1 Tax=Deinococcus sp. Leaf326 TaxID=1736338 RepID=UPI0006F46FEE|nr:aminotransferase class I/II-fold pyridoxal phosphate-dependent enzyme [Deinococcus sp. Leaf326]KQR41256.1 aminotransferase class I [Deinococcus sp. Leaf326]
MTPPDAASPKPVNPDAVNYDDLDPAALRHPDSLKWTAFPEGTLPMWVADMDYPVAPPILRALHERLHAGLGYPQLMGDTRLVRGLQERLAANGLTDLPAEGFKFLPGVVPGLYAAVNALSAPGEAVITMTPVYHPFHLAITDLGRVVAAAPLQAGTERDEIDWNAMELAATQGARLMMLCHPHNPSGRVWDAAELRLLREFALRHDLFVVSDELHADLRFTDAPFESFAADPAVRDRTVTVTGPCKAFNTAGLGIGVLVGHSPELVTRVMAPTTGLMGHPSALSITMWRAALEEGGPWLRDTVAYLRGNRDFLVEFVREQLPWAHVFSPEATYLAWIDLRAHPRAGEIQKVLLEEAGLAVHNGPVFAPEALKPQYQGFVRVNFATSRALLAGGLERLAAALAPRAAPEEAPE